MKRRIYVVMFLINLFNDGFVYAGGVHCRECPSESPNCLPRADCPDPDDMIRNGFCPIQSTKPCYGNLINSSCVINAMDQHFGICKVVETELNGKICHCS